MFAKLMSISDELMWKYFELLSLRGRRRDRASARRDRRPAATRATPRCCWPRRSPRASTARAAAEAARGRLRPARPRRHSRRRSSRSRSSGAPLGIGALLKQARLAPSTSEALRLVDGGGVRIDGAVVSDRGLKLAAGTFVVQVGKRKFARVTLG